MGMQILTNAANLFRVDGGFFRTSGCRWNYPFFKRLNCCIKLKKCNCIQTFRNDDSYRYVTSG